MTVFKACLIIIKQHFGAYALYFGIFITLAVVMTSLSADRYSTDFTESTPNFTVINRDGDTPLSEGLLAYLREHGTEVILEDRKEALQDASFYHATDYIAILPQGFHEAFFKREAFRIETVSTTDSAKSYYADSLVNQYLNAVRLYQASDIGEPSAIAAVVEDLSLEASVEKKRFGAGAPVNEKFRVYSQMLCYIIMVLIILSISNLMQAFRRPDLRMRNLCSPVKPRSMNGQQILCGIIVSVAAWLLLTGVGLIIYGPQISGTDGRILGLILLNTFIIMLVSLSVATLASTFIRGRSAQNAAANFLSLGLCFLGGVFVPLSMLGEGVLAISRFTPAYWYMTALDHICALTSFGGEVLAPIGQAMLIQLAFAVAILCVALVVSKHQNQSERSFGSVRTELEA